MVRTSSVHMASPVSGSRDLDFSLERRAELSVVGPELLIEPSDLAFTSLSEAGWRLCNETNCNYWSYYHHHRDWNPLWQLDQYFLYTLLY